MNVMGKLFQDPRAQKMFCAIPASADPLAIADLFCRVYWHVDRDESAARALEFHLRQCAIVAPVNDEIMIALNRVENCILARRNHARRIASDRIRSKARAVKTRART